METHFELHIAKEQFKFYAAHMTIFPDGTKEALHGHNYMVKLQVRLSSASFHHTISFGTFKKHLLHLCEAWDEKILIQAKNPFVSVTQREAHVEVTACGKRYVFPEEETLVLPLENVTTELLAEYIGRQYLTYLKGDPELIAGPAPKWGLISALTVSVMESPGQGASFAMVFAP